jgi:hypothetical protein
MSRSFETLSDLIRPSKRTRLLNFQRSEVGFRQGDTFSFRREVRFADLDAITGFLLCHAGEYRDCDWGWATEEGHGDTLRGKGCGEGDIKRPEGLEERDLPYEPFSLVDQSLTHLREANEDLDTLFGRPVDFREGLAHPGVQGCGEFRGIGRKAGEGGWNDRFPRNGRI